MRHSYYYEREPIADERDGTIFWLIPSWRVAEIAHALGPVNGIEDDMGDLWSGDEFWDAAGSRVWNNSRIEASR